MRRPQLVHFTAISTEDHLSIRASLSYSRQARNQFWLDPLPGIPPIRPVDSLGLLSSKKFRLRLIGMDKHDRILLNREFDSDDFGDVHIRLPHPLEGVVEKLSVYETMTYPGLDLLIGSFLPMRLIGSKKVVITDFDKTLVDTRYSSPRELYLSLRRPLGYFPPVQSSIDLVKKFADEEYKVFVLSASPHFYENAMRDWLYRNQIFTSNIYLKDYRRVFSFFEGDFGFKDLGTQGFYKLNHLVNILLMTGVPEKLVLV